MLFLERRAPFFVHFVVHGIQTHCTIHQCSTSALKVHPLLCCYLTQPSSLPLLVCSRLFPLPDVISSHHTFEDTALLPGSPLLCWTPLSFLHPGLSWGWAGKRELGRKKRGKRGPGRKGTHRAWEQRKGLQVEPTGEWFLQKILQVGNLLEKKSLGLAVSRRNTSHMIRFAMSMLPGIYSTLWTLISAWH